MVPSSAMTGKSQIAAPEFITWPSMTALAVASLTTALRDVLSSTQAQTPYKPTAWLSHITSACIIFRYPHLHNSLIHGFAANLPSLSSIFTPPNNISIGEHQEVFDEIVAKEFSKGRYLSPLSRLEIKDNLGPFQSSPLSLVSKAGQILPSPKPVLSAFIISCLLHQFPY